MLFYIDVIDTIQYELVSLAKFLNNELHLSIYTFILILNNKFVISLLTYKRMPTVLHLE